MSKGKTLVAICIAALLTLNIVMLSVQAGLFIGGTYTLNAKITEYAGVDSTQPDKPATSLWVANDDKMAYVFVKIDLSGLPPIDKIFILSASLSFGFGSWSAKGQFGFAALGSHYCEDDSWTSTTLTWKNKPTFRSEATGSWGFFGTYMGNQLDFKIAEDVVKTLESGDKILTEVITWSAGSGSTLIGGPNLTIVYASRPVYQLHLDAACDVPNVKIAETTLIQFSVAEKYFGTTNLAPPRFPKLEYASPGTYDLEFQGRCKFSGWQTTGGVSVSNPSQPLARLTIGSDGGLTAKCSLDWVIYGDETLKGHQTYSPLAEVFHASEGYAEKYSPLVSGYLRLVRFYISQNPSPFELHILGMTDDPTKKMPVDIAPTVTVKPTRIGWTEVDLTSQRIKVERDQTYYLSITWLTDGKPVFAEAVKDGPGAYYTFRNNSWRKFSYKVLDQHIVSTTLNEQVRFAETSTTTTTVSPEKTSTTTLPSQETAREAPGVSETAIVTTTLMAITGILGFGAYRFIKRRRPAKYQGKMAPGEALTGKYCVECGTQLSLRAEYCSKCGKKQTI